MKHLHNPQWLARICIIMSMTSLIGCSSTPELTDAGEIAVHINDLMKGVDESLRNITNEMRLAKRDNRDPDVAKSIKVLKQAEADCREAKGLSEESFGPRTKLADVLHLIGSLYALQREIANEQIENLASSGRPVPDKLLSRRDQSDHWMRQYFRESNEELLFMTRYMKLLDPRSVYVLRSVNHAFLEQWGDAAEVLRDYLESFKAHISKDEVARHRQQINRFEEMELKAADAGI